MGIFNFNSFFKKSLEETNPEKDSTSFEKKILLGNHESGSKLVENGRNIAYLSSS